MVDREVRIPDNASLLPVFDESGTLQRPNQPFAQSEMEVWA
jgi:hypothetical protein